MKTRVTLEPMEHRIAAEVLAICIRKAHDRSPFPMQQILGNVILWAAGVIDELRQHGATLVYRHELVELSAPPRKLPPAHIRDVTAEPHISTQALRLHAFSAFAAAMAHGLGREEAEAAATYETLRQTGNWTEAAAAEHTRRFILPAWGRSFPRS